MPLRHHLTQCLAVACSIALLTGLAQAQDAAKDPKAAEFEALTDADTMVMVPMRDGVRLSAAIYAPRESAAPGPILLKRTP